MKREERIAEICVECNAMLGRTLADVIAHAISEGYKLGLEEAKSQFIDKTCDYLSKLTRCAFSSIGGDVWKPVFTDEELKLFRKAMKE